MEEKAEYLPATLPKRKAGTEPFTNAGPQTRTLLDFWSWAYSDLDENAVRGKLAEYIVDMAMGATTGFSATWKKSDLQSSEGISIEVKTSAYVQSCKQNNPSKIIFCIQPTYGSNENETVKKRHADVYVFCVLNHTRQDTLDPLNLSQWNFYVLVTAVLDKSVTTHKTITLIRLLKLGAVKCDFATLKKTIHSAKKTEG